MMRPSLLTRLTPRSYSLISLRPCSNSSTGSGSDGNKSKDDDSKASIFDKDPAKKAVAQEKLSSLLTSLIKKDKLKSSAKNESKIRLSRPVRIQDKQDPITPELKQKYKKVDPEMAEAVRSVSKEVGGGIETQSQLLDSLKSVSGPSDTPAQPDLWNVLSGLQVDKSAEVQRKTTTQKTSFSPSTKVEENVDLFGGKPLQIFPIPPVGKNTTAPSSLSLPTWEKLEREDFAHSLSKPPANHFQELINWTNQGKVWSFPIDNEVGLAEEKSIGFHEHIFLERHLSGWCPKAGPIRHFMELVCVGLSKNPHITVQRKKEVITWYRDFFDSKRDLLEEVGAYPGSKKSSKSAQ